MIIVSHSTKGPSGQLYFHNGDYSGTFDAYLPKEELAEERDHVKIQIPVEDVLRLAAEVMRSRLAEAVEGASGEDLLRFLFRDLRP
ncbi:hypothetical protein ABT282_08415 [Streptomyces sp. NPDC000927]|uniref:hypothetical protein n=1 Tax=Streptomyces sp. NPDC000927 TaxID=3154371 RepID=UPI00331D9246